MANESKSLVAKLAEVMGEINRVGKRGHNTFHNYDYAREADILDEVRERLARRKVFILTSVEQVENRETGRRTREGHPIWMTLVKTKHSFCDGESGERLEVFGHGTGEDMGDKGLYKAITGAMKYVVSKNFLMSTGDDPENDEKAAPASITSESKSSAEAKSDGPLPAESRHQPLPFPSFPEPAPKVETGPERNTVRDYVKDIVSKTGPKKDGSTYTRYSIETLRAGYFTTFNQNFADIAAEAKAKGREAIIGYKANGKWKDVENIRLAESMKEFTLEEVENLPF